jgi:hypothetical protein
MGVVVVMRVDEAVVEAAGTAEVVNNTRVLSEEKAVQGS